VRENESVQQPGEGGNEPFERVANLRARWDPVDATFPDHLKYEGICARMYRAFSWLERVEELADRDGERSADDQLILAWTALNSLYGKWDADRNEPERDVPSLIEFTDHLFEIDKEEALIGQLGEQQSEVLELLDNQFLSRQFWNAPDIDKAAKKTKLRHSARTWYIEKRHRLILEKLLRNVYYMRCQLVHGAATRGSSLNRDTLGPCLRVLRLFLPTMLGIVIDHGHRDDWGPVCYPVVK